MPILPSPPCGLPPPAPWVPSAQAFSHCLPFLRFSECAPLRLG